MNYINYICNYINLKILEIYVHQTLLVLTTVKHVRQLASWTKKLNEKVFLLCCKGSKCLTLCAVLNMLAGSMFMCYCLYMSLSGFLESFHIWFSQCFTHHFCVHCPTLC